MQAGHGECQTGGRPGRAQGAAEGSKCNCELSGYSLTPLCAGRTLSVSEEALGAGREMVAGREREINWWYIFEESESEDEEDYLSEESESDWSK